MDWRGDVSLKVPGGQAYRDLPHHKGKKKDEQSQEWASAQVPQADL